MEVIRRWDSRGTLLTLAVTVLFSDEEMTLIKRYGLSKYRIATHDGRFSGSESLSRNMRRAYRVQVGRVKGRWSAAMVRTTSFAATDTALAIADFTAAKVMAIRDLLIGRRLRLSALMHGYTIRSTRVEQVKEAEFFILLSLATIQQAIEYLKRVGTEVRLGHDELLSSVEGLDFAGAGTDVATEMEVVSELLGAIRA